jgi:hypothetical protein
MLFAVTAQLDRDKALEDQRAAAAKGNHGGRPKVIDNDMLLFAQALKDKGTPVPGIARKLVIKTGKNAGQHPSIASLYRALAEAADSDALAGEALSFRPVPRPHHRARQRDRPRTNGTTPAARHLTQGLTSPGWGSAPGPPGHPSFALRFRLLPLQTAPGTDRARAYVCKSPAPGGHQLACLLERLLVSGAFLLWCCAASIEVITAPSTSHAATIPSSRQLTTAGLPIAGEYPGSSPQTFARYMSARPAIHAPAHAAVRSQLRCRQPRSLTNPAMGTGIGSTTHAANARTTAILTASGSVLHSGIPRLTSAQLGGCVVTKKM